MEDVKGQVKPDPEGGQKQAKKEGEPKNSMEISFKYQDDEVKFKVKWKSLYSRPMARSFAENADIIVLFLTRTQRYHK
jgi:hypothetical protein